MLAKLTTKNQLTLLKRVVAEVGAEDYFDVEVRNGQIVSDSRPNPTGRSGTGQVGELNLEESDLEEAVT